MKRSDAERRLRRMVAATLPPLLSDADIADLLSFSRSTDGAGNALESVREWEPLTAFAVGERIVPSAANLHAYVCTVAGTSGATEPAWPTASAATIADGGATWREDGATAWRPTYDLDYAAAMGWGWKADAAAAHVAITADGHTIHREQLVQHCHQRQAAYQARIAGTISASRADG